MDFRRFPGTMTVPAGRQRRPAPKNNNNVASKKLVEFWVMFDTQVFAANPTAVTGGTALTLANYVSPLTFFDTRTVGNSGEAITSMNNKAYIDHPFKAYGMGIEVHCDVDAASTSALTQAASFVETVVMYSSVVLKFGGDVKLIMPTSDAPAGGGVVYGVRTDARALAANQMYGSACNGVQSAAARVLFPAPLYFKSGPEASFGVNLVTGGTATHGALARIQGLAALTSEFEASIRIKFWGVRGKGLLPGASDND